MSLLERVLEAAGADRWPAVRRFTSHLMLDGPLLAPLQGPYSFKEIVAEGDIASRSIRISGFSGAGAQWGFHPDFITIQHDDGAFVSARQPSAPRSFRGHKNEADLVYICGLSIWICLTGPLAMLSEGVQVEELGAWSEHGQNWSRLKVRAPEGALAYARESVMYFSDDGLLRRTDFDLLCGEMIPIVVYSSAHQCFSCLTVPTLHRAVAYEAAEGAPQRTPLLDIEIFDATFD